MELLELLSNPLATLVGSLSVIGAGAIVAYIKGIVGGIITYLYKDRIMAYWERNLRSLVDRDWMDTLMLRRNPYRKVAKRIMRNDKKGLI